MSKVLHRVSTGTHDAPAGCHHQPPEFECVERVSHCEPEECGSCPPKTKARHSEAIGYMEGQRCVSLRGRGCAPKQLPMFMHCIEMRVRLKGSCKVITREIPYKATYTGAACFNWSKRFKALPNGYYEGDIYINGKSCVSWPFHIQDCYYEVGTESVTDLQDDCHAVECATACGRCHQTACQCSKPPLEVEIETVRADCGGCEQC